MALAQQVLLGHLDMKRELALEIVVGRRVPVRSEETQGPFAHGIEILHRPLPGRALLKVRSSCGIAEQRLHDRDHLIPALLLDGQMAPPGRCDRVETRLPVVLRRAPASAYQAALL